MPQEGPGEQRNMRLRRAPTAGVRNGAKACGMLRVGRGGLLAAPDVPSEEARCRMRSGEGWYLDDGGTLVIDGFVPLAETDAAPWRPHADHIKAATVRRGAQVERFGGLFAGCHQLAAVDGVGNLTCPEDNAGAEDASDMFAGCSALRRIDLSAFDASRLRSAWGMFQDCRELREIALPARGFPELREAGSMFRACRRLRSFDFAALSAPNLEDASDFFRMCTGLGEVSFADARTGRLFTAERMFYGCRGLVCIAGASGLQTGRIENLSSMFRFCARLQHLDCASWDTTSVREATFLFDGCLSLSQPDVSAWRMPRLQTARGMFARTPIERMDLAGWGTHELIDMSYMFDGCTSLREVSLGAMDLSGALRAQNMFAGCAKLERIAHEGRGMASVRNAAGLFCGCASLTRVPDGFVDLERVEDAHRAREGCPAPLP